jgi:hypothetical protein
MCRVIAMENGLNSVKVVIFTVPLEDSPYSFHRDLKAKLTAK